MDAFRYWLAVVTIVAWPTVLAFWLIVHPLVRVWRRAGVGVTYGVMLLVMVAIGRGMFLARGRLVGLEFGTQWPLVALGALLFALSGLIEARRRRLLPMRTLVGIPELSPEDPGVLLTDGIYGQVRHPRYLGALVGIVATAFVTNYLALYLMVPVVLLLTIVIIRLEERELVERFGDRYRQYQQRVPMLVPRLRSSSTR